MYIVEFIYNGKIEHLEYETLSMVEAFVKYNKLENNHKILYVDLN